MKGSSELIELCRDPFTLWTLCWLRRDDKFGEFIRRPNALAEHVKSSEERFQREREESNTLAPHMVVMGRMTSPEWRTAQRLKGATMQELIEGLSKTLSTDNIIWPVIFNNGCEGLDVRKTLTRCYFVFS